MSSKRGVVNLVSLLFLLSSISKSLLIKIIINRSSFKNGLCHLNMYLAKTTKYAELLMGYPNV